jgi:hypothetical protein
MGWANWIQRAQPHLEAPAGARRPCSPPHAGAVLATLGVVLDEAARAAIRTGGTQRDSAGVAGVAVVVVVIFPNKGVTSLRGGGGGGGGEGGAPADRHRGVVTAAEEAEGG